MQRDRENTTARTHRAQAARFWDERAAETGPELWLAHAQVRRDVNRLVSGDESS